jgi:gas vesicle protein
VRHRIGREESIKLRERECEGGRAMVFLVTLVQELARVSVQQEREKSEKLLQEAVTRETERSEQLLSQQHERLTAALDEEKERQEERIKSVLKEEGEKNQVRFEEGVGGALGLR